MTQLPAAMLIDMDDTILSAYGRPDIAWNSVAAEFAGELAPLSPQQVATPIVEYARQFWAVAQPEWRLKIAQARHEVVRGGFSALAVAGQTGPLNADCGTDRGSLHGVSGRTDVRLSGRA